MSVIVEFVGGLISQILMEFVFYKTGRHVLRVISFGRIQAPPFRNQEGEMAGPLLALFVGAIFWLVILAGIVFALYLAVF